MLNSDHQIVLKNSVLPSFCKKEPQMARKLITIRSSFARSESE